jgi:hypothetical protein
MNEDVLYHLNTFFTICGKNLEPTVMEIERERNPDLFQPPRAD